MKQRLEDSLKYQEWLKTLQSNGIQVNKVEPLQLIYKSNGEIIFALLSVDAQDQYGEKLLPIVLLRGHFVSIATVLIEKETQEKYLLLVRQYRIANGEYTYEHPAGMCDSSTDIWQVAIKEIEEETGLKVEKSQLRLLNEKPLYTSPGLLDEGGYLFACEIVMSRAEIEQFRNRKTGAEGEREFITTHICPIQEAFGLMSSLTAQLNLMMYLQKC
ncbi:MAG: NUDIX hydrolase [Raineya sp.]|nr:NUDIX hydrolase [Raineya sp.]